MAKNPRAEEIGKIGEVETKKYLQLQGYTILDTNWRIKEGEIDLVALTPQGIFLFIEVKSRSSTTFGHPLEAITREKAWRIQRLALAWLATHSQLGSPYRIDACAVLINYRNEVEIDYRAGVL